MACNGADAGTSGTQPGSNFVGNSLELTEDDWDEALAQINLNIHRNDTIPTPMSDHSYTFKGIQIHFPYPAYTSQLQMMEKIIEGVTTGENCLLESPTGTGKTAALLCSLLGWQKECRRRRDNCLGVIEAAAERLGGCTCGLIKNSRTKIRMSFSSRGALQLEAETPSEGQDVSPSTSRNPTPVKFQGSASGNTTPVKSEIPSPSGNISLSPMVLTQNSTSFSANASSPMNVCPSPSTSSNSSPVKSYIPSSHPGTPVKPTSPYTFESPAKKQRLASCPGTPSSGSADLEVRRLDAACAYCVKKHVVDKARPPKIYYATRTHTQIAQVVKQLKGTAYRDVRMTILASREPTCIHETIHEEVNHAQIGQEDGDVKLTADDVCRQLRSNYFKIEKLQQKHPGTDWTTLADDQGRLVYPVCKYFRKKLDLAYEFDEFQSRGAWDLEDVKREGKSCELCPYYGGYAMQGTADIVFCSYNYLIDPMLRETAAIKFVNSVIVFDEAHNIEDICRSSFSAKIDAHKFDKDVHLPVINLLKKVENNSGKLSFQKHVFLQRTSETFHKWSTWIYTEGEKLSAPVNSNFDVHESFESDRLKSILEQMEMTHAKIQDLMLSIESFNKGPDSDSQEEEDYYLDRSGVKRPFIIGSSVTMFLKKLQITLEYLDKEERDGIGGSKDFKGFLTRSLNPYWKPPSSQFSQLSGRASNEPKFLYTFQILCLNPALAFRTLRSCAYNVIVASGTLTPLNSFASELATKFEITLQADHVIPRSHVWAGVVSFGPSNQQLELVKRNQDLLDVQDEIGNVIVQICETVPNGVLVFIPSYGLLRKLEARWKTYPRANPILRQIGRTKLIFKEESPCNKAIFKRNMDEYVSKVKGGPSWNGCILFAVFRGKISEGIDFADEQARAVITIGIPYSSFGSADIKSKKEYNDMKRRSPRQGEAVLSGFEWYTTQAFRAMNQGFGRCVRHKNDWGALILIDCRLGEAKHAPYISKWVQNNLQVFHEFSQVTTRLRQFIAERQAHQRRPPIRIEYEEDPNATNALDATEIIPFPENGNCGNGPDELTQVVRLPCHEGQDRDVTLHHTLTTQRIPPNLDVSSSPSSPAILADSSIVAVGESSPEYSFTEETQRVLEAFPQTSTPVDMEAAYGPHASQGSESTNDSDLEMSRIADEMQSTGNYSSFMDVSMASGGRNEGDVSQASSISYHSDCD